jgi:hypothetical protein
MDIFMMDLKTAKFWSAALSAAAIIVVVLVVNISVLTVIRFG